MSLGNIKREQNKKPYTQWTESTEALRFVKKKKKRLRKLGKQAIINWINKTEKMSIDG